MDIETMMKIAEESLSNTAGEIARAARCIDANELARIVDALDNCPGRVMITGVGTSGAAARKIAHSLACLEVPAVYLSPGDALHGASGMIRSGDVMIFISKGGRSEEINTLLRISRNRGALTVGVTESHDNELARGVEMVLKVAVERESDRAGILATASTLTVIAAFDAICSILMEKRGFDERGFLHIHPGGDVGVRLAENNPGS